LCALKTDGAPSLQLVVLKHSYIKKHRIQQVTKVKLKQPNNTENPFFIGETTKSQQGWQLSAQQKPFLLPH